jgi:hypothetical protein
MRSRKPFVTSSIGSRVQRFIRSEGNHAACPNCKSSGLIGLVAASLLLCSVQSFQPAPKLYRAKPDDVPAWAEQGNLPGGVGCRPRSIRLMTPVVECAGTGKSTSHLLED